MSRVLLIPCLLASVTGVQHQMNGDDQMNGDAQYVIFNKGVAVQIRPEGYEGIEFEYKGNALCRKDNPIACHEEDITPVCLQGDGPTVFKRSISGEWKQVQDLDADLLQTLVTLSIAVHSEASNRAAQKDYKSWRALFDYKGGQVWSSFEHEVKVGDKNITVYVNFRLNSFDGEASGRSVPSKVKDAAKNIRKITERQTFKDLSEHFAYAVYEQNSQELKLVDFFLMRHANTCANLAKAVGSDITVFNGVSPFWNLYQKGRAKFNQTRIFPDTKISDLGIESSQYAGKDFAKQINEKGLSLPSHVFVSTLHRTTETALFTIKGMCEEVSTSTDFAEKFCGENRTIVLQDNAHLGRNPDLQKLCGETHIYSTDKSLIVMPGIKEVGRGSDNQPQKQFSDFKARNSKIAYDQRLKNINVGIDYSHVEESWTRVKGDKKWSSFKEHFDTDHYFKEVDGSVLIVMHSGQMKKLFLAYNENGQPNNNESWKFKHAMIKRSNTVHSFLVEKVTGDKTHIQVGEGFTQRSAKDLRANDKRLVEKFLEGNLGICQRCNDKWLNDSVKGLFGRKIGPSKNAAHR